MAQSKKAPTKAPAKVVPLKTPERTIVLEGQPIRLRADFAAMYALEELTGQNLFQLASNQSNDRIYTVVAQLLYALSASHREDSGMDVSFRRFLRMLPDIGMGEFNRLSQIAFTMIGEAMQSAAASGNAPTPAT